MNNKNPILKLPPDAQRGDSIRSSIGAIHETAEFITLLGGAATWPLGGACAASAPQKSDFYIPGQKHPRTERVETLREVLRANGWPDDRVGIVKRFADGDSSRATALAKELVNLKCEMILTVSFLERIRVRLQG